MNIKCSFLTIFLCLQLSFFCLAQENIRYTTLGLSLGAHAVLNKDQFYSPFTYKGANLVTGFQYSRFKPKVLQQMEVTYSGGKIKSSVSPNASSRLIGFNFDYFFKLSGRSGNRYTVWLGPCIHSFLNSVNYLPSVQNPVTYFTGNIAITVGGMFRYSTTDKLAVSLTAGMPLAGYVYRPDFEIYGKTLEQITFGSGVLSARIELEYQVSSRVAITANYRYSYFAFSEPRPIYLLRNGLSLGLRVKF